MIAATLVATAQTKPLYGPNDSMQGIIDQAKSNAKKEELKDDFTTKYGKYKKEIGRIEQQFKDDWSGNRRDEIQAFSNAIAYLRDNPFPSAYARQQYVDLAITRLSQYTDKYDFLNAKLPASRDYAYIQYLKELQLNWPSYDNDQRKALNQQMTESNERYGKTLEKSNQAVKKLNATIEKTTQLSNAYNDMVDRSNKLQAESRRSSGTSSSSTSGKSGLNTDEVRDALREELRRLNGGGSHR
jgi:hypothetical protein